LVNYEIIIFKKHKIYKISYNIYTYLYNVCFIIYIARLSNIIHSDYQYNMLILRLILKKKNEKQYNDTILIVKAYIIIGTCIPV